MLETIMDDPAVEPKLTRRHMDVSDLANMSGKQCSPQLWNIYEQMIAKLEEERCFISAEIENLLVPVEDRHRVEWERKRRIAEIYSLTEKLKQVEQQLLSRQEELVRIAGENDRLRAQSAQWNEELERVHVTLRPRIDAVHYSPGCQPEKLGRFVPAASTQAAPSASSTARGQAPSSVESSSPILVEYLPYDRRESTEEHLQKLRQRLANEQKGHKFAQETIQNLKLIEKEEHELCLTALRQQIDRIKTHRQHIRGRTDEVLQRHTHLKAENEGLKIGSTSEIQQLLDSNDVLSRRLEAVSSHGAQEILRAEEQSRQLKNKAACAYMTGVMRAREDAGALHKQIDEAQAQSLRSIEGFERQLTALKKRYDTISNHRTKEVNALRVDIEGLRRAVRMCEKHAMHCLSSGFHKGGVVPELVLQHSEQSSGSSPNCQIENRPSAGLDALALRPLLAKLRTVMERCEVSLKEEQRHLNASRNPGRSSSEHQDVVRECNVEEYVTQEGSVALTPPSLQ